MVRNLLLILTLLACLGANPVHASTILMDHFDGNALNPQWTVIRQDASKYSLANSILTIHPSNLEYTFPYQYQNIFLIHNPLSASDNYQITSQINGVSAVGDEADHYKTNLSIVAYDDDTNYIQCNYLYYNIVYPQQSQDVSLYATFHTMTAGVFFPLYPMQSIGQPIPWGKTPNSSRKAFPFWLRLTKIGNTYKQFYSLDGSAYHQFNQDKTFGNGKTTYLGFMVFTDPDPPPNLGIVKVHYFKLEKLP